MELQHLPLVVALLVSGACDAQSYQVRADGAQAAVERARHGLGLSGNGQATAARVRLGAATLPFLATEIAGREAWRVEISDPHWSSIELPYLQALTVLLAPDGLAVLRVDSAWPDREPAMAPYPATAVEERQLAAHDERFSGVPPDSADVTLARALAVIAVNGGDLAHTRQIIAYRVARQTLQYRERPVWIVQLRGIPPIAAAGPGVPVDARNHLRHVVDARTGEWLGADTIPQPEDR